MQAPEVLHDPVLHLLSSHGRECTTSFSDPNNKEIAATNTTINPILISDILRFRDGKKKKKQRFVSFLLHIFLVFEVYMVYFGKSKNA